MQAILWVIALSPTFVLAPAVFAVCPAAFYITDANDLIQIKGKAYDNAGNETKVKCTLADPWVTAAYGAFTGGASDPPSRMFQGFPYGCPALDPELGYPFGAAGADVQVVKNGTPKNACKFVGQYSLTTWPHGFYVSTVLKFDAAGNFKSESGTLTYNLSSGSFVGTFKVVAKP
jgi:hypothetical protein